MSRVFGEFRASASPDDAWVGHYFGPQQQPRTDSCALSRTDFFAGLRPTREATERTQQYHSHTFYVSSFVEVHVQRDGRRETVRRQHASEGACASLVGTKSEFRWGPRRPRHICSFSSPRARTLTEIAGAARTALTSGAGRFPVDGLTDDVVSFDPYRDRCTFQRVRSLRSLRLTRTMIGAPCNMPPFV